MALNLADDMLPQIMEVMTFGAAIIRADTDDIMDMVYVYANRRFHIVAGIPDGSLNGNSLRTLLGDRPVTETSRAMFRLARQGSGEHTSERTFFPASPNGLFKGGWFRFRMRSCGQNYVIILGEDVTGVVQERDRVLNVLQDLRDAFHQFKAFDSDVSTIAEHP